MDSSGSRIGELFERFYNKTATEAERQELMSWIGREATDEELSRLVRHSWETLEEGKPFFGREKGEAMLAHILPAVQGEETNAVVAVGQDEETNAVVPVVRFVRWYRVVAVAAAVAAVIVGIWLVNPRMARIKEARRQQVARKDIVPGGDKALLILADGSSVVLDSARAGVIGKQGSTTISKAAGGRLVYAAGKGGVAVGKDGAAVSSGYNTIATPRGGQYEVTLADGSKVWLNASSSLRFPAAFSGSSREVELSGEGYFEIASNPSMPFLVRLANDTRVQVLGTRFDIMAYSDEQVVKATLLQGAVKVSKGGASSVLRPGQQARMPTASSSIQVVDDPDAEAAIAWKNGIFEFNRADIHTIMRQVARWYDVDVRFEGNLPDREFVGKVSRSANIGQVLRILELSHIHFRIEGRTIVVLS